MSSKDDSTETKISIGWALRVSTLLLVIVATSFLHSLLGKDLAKDILFVLSTILGFSAAFIIAGLFDLHHWSSKLANYVINSNVLKRLAHEQQSFIFRSMILSMVWMGLSQASWSLWNILNPDRDEGDFLFCPDVWSSPLRWLYDLGPIIAFGIALSAIVSRGLVEFSAEFVGKRRDQSLKRISILIAFYSALFFLLERFYPETLFQLLSVGFSDESCI